ncbi:hypothetical protein RSAG8_00020, partial [Rhizoctonia solani AG-8 WAC10335]
MSLGRDAGANIVREMRELPLPPSGSPVTPRLPISNADIPRSSVGVDLIQRPRGDTGSSTSSRGSDGPSSAGTVSTVPTSFSASVEKSGVMPGTNNLGIETAMLVNNSTSQGSIAQRRKSAQPSGHASALHQALQQQSQHQLPPLPQTPTSLQQHPVMTLPPPPAAAPTTTRLTADNLPAGAASRLGIAPGRLRASSQPGRRPDMPAPGIEVPSLQFLGEWRSALRACP